MAEFVVVSVVHTDPVELISTRYPETDPDAACQERLTCALAAVAVRESTVETAKIGVALAVALVEPTPSAVIADTRN